MAKKQNINYKKDISVLVMLPLAAAAVTIIFSLNFLEATMLFYGLPAAYLSYVNPKSIWRAAIFSGVMAVFGGIIIDYFAVTDNSWHVPTMFSFRLLNLVPIEDIIWCFLLAYFAVMFYIHFFEKSKQTSIGKHTKGYIEFAGTIFAVFCLLIVVIGLKPHIPFFYYFGFSFALLLPLFAFVVTWPKFITALLAVTAYFIAVNLLQELVALHSGHWTFPGTNYVGWVSVVSYRFPVEELVLFIGLFAPATIAYFEFFTDDKIKYKTIWTKTKK